MTKKPPRLKLSSDQRALMFALLDAHPKPVFVTNRTPMGCSLARKQLVTKVLAKQRTALTEVFGRCRPTDQLAELTLTPLGLKWFTEEECKFSEKKRQKDSP